MAFLQMIGEVLSLDIYNINYAYAAVKLGKLSLIPPQGLPRAGILVRISSMFWHFLKCFGELNFFLPGSEQENPIIFCAATNNQRNSLLPIAEKLGNSKLVSFNLYGRFDDKDMQRFPSIYIYLLSFPFVPIVFLKFLGARDYRRLSFHYAFDQYLLIYGYYLASRFWLKYLKPACLVIASDHDVVSRALVEAARCEGIPTILVQHASVNEKFPPLFTDVALLEGEYALKSYESAGPSITQVFLIGMPKADAYTRFLNSSPYIRSVGICLNALDPIDRVHCLCAHLRHEFPDLIIHLRPHPGDRRVDLWKSVCDSHNLFLSNSKRESSLDFLMRVDAIVAGDSNIILEATLMNVYPIYYDFAQRNLDWYGFKRNGLVNYYCDPEDVSFEIRRLCRIKPSVRERAKIYCSTIGTSYDGHSAELASALMKQLVKGGEVDKATWTRVPGSKLEAYQLSPASAGSPHHQSIDFR